MQKNTVQQALPPNAAPLRFAAQVKCRPLARLCDMFVHGLKWGRIVS